jgi:hypothetical protein
MFSQGPERLEVGAKLAAATFVMNVEFDDCVLGKMISNYLASIFYIK